MPSTHIIVSGCARLSISTGSAMWSKPILLDILFMWATNLVLFPFRLWYISDNIVIYANQYMWGVFMKVHDCLMQKITFTQLQTIRTVWNRSSILVQVTIQSMWIVCRTKIIFVIDWSLSGRIVNDSLLPSYFYAFAFYSNNSGWSCQ